MVKRILITGGSGFIGTNLIDYLSKNYPNYELLNLDNSFPRYSPHKMYWKECDLKKIKTISKLISDFQPDAVIHLAAKASLDGTSITDFPDNILGTKNLVNCIQKTKSINKFLHTSTQYVCTPGMSPKSETEFSPYTPYGASKAESEKIVRNSDLKCNWAILRPTNIWGPWHSFFPYELWKFLAKRFYFHPGFSPIIKHYGFIGNAVIQIDKILHLSDEKKLNQVYYITDPPIDNSEWMNAFSKALCGKKIWRIPKILWRIMAIIGSIGAKIGVKFPLDLNRYFRLTVNEKLPYQKTIDLAGIPLYNLDSGVKCCIQWLSKYYPSLLRKLN